MADLNTSRIRTINVRGGENPLVGEDDQDRGSFLEAIAIRYAQNGQISQAVQVAQAIGNRTVRQQAADPSTH